jgi:hypothetical protein
LSNPKPLIRKFDPILETNEFLKRKPMVGL